MAVTKSASYLTLDDGSGSPVNVQIGGLVAGLTSVPNVGEYISATGPAGLMGGGVPNMRMRSGSDLQVL